MQYNELIKEQQQLERAGKLHWFHWVIVLSSLILTFGAWGYTKHQSDEKRLLQFQNEVEYVLELFSERMQKYEDALWSGVATVRAQTHGIDYLEWKRFADTLHIEQKYPGINGMGIIFHVKREDVDDFLSEQRELRPNFQIHPQHEQNELLPITFIEPLDANKAAEGLDMAHEKNRYTAARKARDTNTPQITAPIVLVQDAKKTPGFLFFAPFYEENTLNETIEQRQKNFIGMVYAPFIFTKLMEGTLEKTKRQISMKISDEGDVLYDEHIEDNSKEYDPHPLYRNSTTIEMYGRPWTFEMQTTNSFRHSTENNKPWIILFGGLFIDAMLLALFVFLAYTNKRALNFAKHMIGAHETQSMRLETIIEQSADGLITIDERGTIESFNPAAERAFGYQADEVIGQNVKILMPEPDKSQHDGYLNNYHDTGEKKIIGIGREVLGRKKTGTVFPMDLSVSEIKLTDRKIYSGTIRDLTKEKKEAAFKNLIMKNIPDMIFVKDKEFRIVQANDAFLNVYPDDKKDQVIGYTTFEDYDPQEAEKFMEYDRIAFEEGYSEAEETVTR